MKDRLSYKKAGVDIDKGDSFVKNIAPLVSKTFRPEVLSDIGSFGSLFRLNKKKYKDPVLVSATDGVGTKLKVAFLTERHDTVGIDLVAMCVNDILTCGAEPLFFLDYFATGRLKPRTASAVIKGIADGCIEAGCSLIGGETAEMPGFYGKGEYDLSGFAVGVVDRREIVDGRTIKKGDSIIGVSSNGLHSNGFSLVRKIFFDMKRLTVKTVLKETGRTLGEELLKPTRIYVKAFHSLKKKVIVKGMAHITGGGMTENIPRILPKGLEAVIIGGSWPEQAIFRFVQQIGQLSHKELFRTFNMGIGYIFVVDSNSSSRTIKLLKKNNYEAFIIGGIEKGKRGVRYA